MQVCVRQVCVRAGRVLEASIIMHSLTQSGNKINNAFHVVYYSPAVLADPHILFENFQHHVTGFEHVVCCFS